MIARHGGCATRVRCSSIACSPASFGPETRVVAGSYKATHQVCTPRARRTALRITGGPALQSRRRSSSASAGVRHESLSMTQTGTCSKLVAWELARTSCGRRETGRPPLERTPRTITRVWAVAWARRERADTEVGKASRSREKPASFSVRAVHRGALSCADAPSGSLSRASPCSRLATLARRGL